VSANYAATQVLPGAVQERVAVQARVAARFQNQNSSLASVWSQTALSVGNIVVLLQCVLMEFADCMLANRSFALDLHGQPCHWHTIYQ
jgi:hypothetical protein